MLIDRSRLALLAKMELIFWDFDGVIKDSVEVKTKSFKDLFMPYGLEVANRVVAHHEKNGGLSRYEKMPLYMEWASLDVDEKSVGNFCDLFAKSVFQKVIDSPWVPGVLTYLKDHYKDQKFVLITATPQDEIKLILEALDIKRYFEIFFGAPIGKREAIEISLKQFDIAKINCIMIGDSDLDLQAAEQSRINFILRRTSINSSLQKLYQGPQFKDFMS